MEEMKRIGMEGEGTALLKTQTAGLDVNFFERGQASVNLRSVSSPESQAQPRDDFVDVFNPIPPEPVEDEGAKKGWHYKHPNHSDWRR